ncbi:flagellar hook-length control protein FliK [Vibrio anguillarum]|uniref:Flagellar hook-length control protein FliK n=1 Tax=Vibrio anguillarum TaxID=55601 RepID=A0A289GDS0_VIBAN|nr:MULTISPECIES: flagellar hook-length control protein FliK [Vibrio]ASW81596.1 flagellar hook-length control protein FliK [Vibrio anguillarum]AZS24160.1 flagellar hook-length control protein FliK [Vibrio anguillarum]MBF4309304.1 flagellar hook-length control protein FliK [Vibrio anguillarum]MBF4324957.1 flagellar hook-length control protein FliK [Vibrio anguillarum]MBT2920899.1 flagellar hook-length control protein FliK [Vibrio anguillarum]
MMKHGLLANNESASSSVFSASIMDMNVNITTPSDTSKMASVSKAGSDAVSEGSESQGFFEKLTTLIMGRSTESSAETDFKALDEGAVLTDDVAAQSSDALLDKELGEALSEEADLATVQTKSPPSAEVDDSALQQKTAQVMSDGDEILGRLNSANQALADQNGKTLPQNTHPVDVQIDDNAGDSSDQVEQKAPAAAQISAQDVFAKPTTEPVAPTSVNEQAPLSDQHITEQDAERVLPIQQGKERLMAAEGSPTASSLNAETEENSELILPESVRKFIQPPQDTKSVQASALSQAIEDEATLLATTEVGDATVNAVAKSDNAMPIESSPLVEAQALDSQLTTNLAEGKLPISPSPSANTPQTDSENDQQGLPTEALLTAAAIPWANTVVAEGQALPLDVAQSETVLKGKNTPVSLAHSVQQALAQQQSQTMQTAVAADKAALASSPLVTASNELSNVQIQQLANAAAIPAATHAELPLNPALFKAGLGAKALSGVNDAGSAQEQKEGTLAQQLSSALGQHGLNATQSRADNLQAAQQPPLLLNREMASEQMAERLQMMMSKNLKHVDIRLDPPELGRLQIRMNMNGDHTTVHFTVANHQARDVIEQSMPRLREMLAQQGVQLGETSVQQQSAGQQQARYTADGDAQSGQLARNGSYLDEENLDTDVKLDLNVASKRDGISYYA